MVSKHFPLRFQKATSPLTHLSALHTEKGPQAVQSALGGEVYTFVPEMRDAAEKAATEAAQY